VPGEGTARGEQHPLDYIPVVLVANYPGTPFETVFMYSALPLYVDLHRLGGALASTKRKRCDWGSSLSIFDGCSAGVPYFLCVLRLKRFLAQSLCNISTAASFRQIIRQYRADQAYNTQPIRTVLWRVVAEALGAYHGSRTNISIGCLQSSTDIWGRRYGRERRECASFCLRGRDRGRRPRKEHFGTKGNGQNPTISVCNLYLPATGA
jgi:hypothetical protein